MADFTMARTDMDKLFGDPAYLQARMSSACLIIIGIELIKMITAKIGQRY